MSSSGQCSNGQRRPFRFFKIITNHSLRDRKLMLPKKVRTRLISHDGSVMWNRPATILVVKEGLSWQMELWNDEEQGRLCLRKGFDQFAVFYSLAPGHLLRFKHVRDLQFSVRIHDRSASEIEYPSFLPDDDSGEEPQPDDDIDFETHDDKDSDFETSPGRENQSGRRSYGKKKMNERNPEPGKTTSFGITITETCIALGQADIPASFSERYMKESEKMGVKVRNGEKVWEMKVSKMGKKNAARITAGWSEFARDNDLHAGHVCIFKLLNATAAAACPLFHVTILRNLDIF